MLLACRVSGFTSAYTLSSMSRTFRNVRQNDHAAGASTIDSVRIVNARMPLATPVTVSNHVRCTATVFITTVSGNVAACSSSDAPCVSSSVIGSPVCKGKASGHGHATRA